MTAPREEALQNDTSSPSWRHASADSTLRPHGGRRFVWAILAIAIAGAGYVAYRHFRIADEGPVRYRTERLERGDIEKQVTATGTVSALVTVTVGSQVSGRIQELLVDYNAQVRKGQVIARIDSQLSRTEVARAQANLAAARASLAKASADAREAKLQYERDRGLAEKKVVAAADVATRLAALQAAEAQVAAAGAAIQQAQATLNQARTNLAYTTIVSPIDGIVVSRSVNIGQTVAASLQAPTLFVIAEDMRRMEVHTSVAESDVGQLREGMAVRFSVDAFPDEEFAGVVKQVRFEAQTVQNVVTYDAVISVDNEQLKLRPGMTANVTFVVWAQKGVLKVPSAALRFRLPAASGPEATTGRSAAVPPLQGTRALHGGKRIWVLRDGSPTSASIKTGISDGTYSEVREGDVREGDAVIVGLEGAGEATSGGTRGGFRGPPRIL